MTRVGGRVFIVGIYVADLAFHADRLPVLGETVLGQRFAMGPGGKGSNQAVAAARAGATTTFCSRLGDDDFARMARAAWAADGIEALIHVTPDVATGAAFIYLQTGTGANAIIVAPGAAGTMEPSDIDAVEDRLAAQDVFMVQFEQPVPVALRGLELARRHGVTTILNPAPAVPVDDAIWPLCDWVTPNETEAQALTGVDVVTPADAERAAQVLLAKGARGVVVTLGAQGVLLHDGRQATHVPAIACGPVVETTGAGDAFNGAFATALAEGRDALAAARSGCATAGISVTRAGTAPWMPRRDEIDAVLARQGA